jgi:hypothetical protein
MKIDLPYLDAWFDCWLFQVQTVLWRTRWDTDCRDYVILEFRILRKWGFRLRLYDTGMRIFERKHGMTMDQAREGKIARMTRLDGDQQP